MAGLVAAAHAGPSAVVTAVAAGLGAAAGLGGWRLGLLVAAVLAGQVSIGWANDWLDAVRGLDDGRAEKPAAAGVLPVPVVRRSALAAAALCAVLSLALGPAAGVVHLVAVASGWAYDVALKGTAASVLPYLVSFGLLPSVATAAATASAAGGWGVQPWPPAWAPLWAAACGACFGGGVHLANALPDLEVDRAAGVRGLPQRLGARTSVVGAVLLLAAGLLAVLVGPPAPPAGVDVVVAALGGVAAALLLGLLVTGLRGRAVLAERLASACGLAVIGVLLARGDALAG